MGCGSSLGCVWLINDPKSQIGKLASYLFARRLMRTEVRHSTWGKTPIRHAKCQVPELEERLERRCRLRCRDAAADDADVAPSSSSLSDCSRSMATLRWRMLRMALSLLIWRAGTFSSPR